MYLTFDFKWPKILNDSKQYEASSKPTLASQDSTSPESNHWVPIQTKSAEEERTLSKLGSTMETHLR